MTEPSPLPAPDSTGDGQPDQAVMSGPMSGWLGSAVVHLALLMAVLLIAEGPFGPGAGGRAGGHGTGGGDGSIAASFGFGAELDDGTAGTEADVVPVSFESPALASIQTVIPATAETPAWVPSQELKSAEWTHVVLTTGGTARVADEQGSSSGLATEQLHHGFGAGAGTEAGPGAGPDFGKGDGRGGTSLFGIADAGVRYVYVIDRSISMQDYGALDAARAELAASLDRINSTGEFQVIFFNQEPQKLTPRRGDEFFRGIDAHRRLAVAQMQLIPAEGATRPLPALLEALRLEPDVVFVLTDGDRPRLTAEELRRIRLKNGGRARIHCIRFVNSADDAGGRSWLAQLAAENCGQYVVHDVRRTANSN